jgi:23S rRNA maturation-related 3'-5' exoribonuclease YhaM
MQTAMMAISAKERDHHNKAKLAEAVVSMLNQAAQVAGLSNQL